MDAVRALRERANGGTTMSGRFRHGCRLATALLAVPWPSRADDDARPVRSRRFDIQYTVNDSALPLDSVQLWYTLDRGETWLEFGRDEDRHSPMPFEAPREGLFGLYLVVTNAAGPSCPPPGRGVQPHLLVHVDFTPPIVQLYPLRQSAMLGQRVVHVRWTAIDAQFGPRPVEVEYQRTPGDEWVLMTPEPVANTGLLDWRVPDDLAGSVGVRVSVRDQGGHRVSSERQVVEILAPGAALVSGVAEGADPRSDKRPASASAARTEERVLELLRAAGVHRDRGEYREGIARLRDVVKLDPHRADALVEMADMLYRVGDLDRALGAYELALRQEPTIRDALRGAAMIYRRNNDHASAARMLRTILRNNPNDAEVWMNLGDVAIYQGDEMLARECYTRASQIDPGATSVIADARKRLELMAEVSRRYQARNDR